MRNKMVKCRRIQTTLTEKARNNNSNELTNEGLYVEKVKCIKTFKQYVPIAYVLQIASTLFFGFSVSFSVYLLFLLLLRFAFGYLYMRWHQHKLKLFRLFSLVHLEWHWFIIRFGVFLTKTKFEYREIVKRNRRFYRRFTIWKFNVHRQEICLRHTVAISKASKE